jgi:hypothetical protein
MCIDKYGMEQELVRFPTLHNMICWKMLYTSGFCHPVTIIKKEVFNTLKGYNPEALHVEDYDFFIRSSKVTQLRNVDDVLFLYRWHGSSVSSIFKRIQKLNHMKYSKMQMETFNLVNYNDDCLHFLKESRIKEGDSIPTVAKFLFELYSNFKNQYSLTKYEQIYIKRDVARKSIELIVIGYKKDRVLGIYIFFRSFLFHPPILLWLFKILIGKVRRPLRMVVN